MAVPQLLENSRLASLTMYNGLQVGIRHKQLSILDGLRHRSKASKLRQDPLGGHSGLGRLNWETTDGLIKVNLYINKQVHQRLTIHRCCCCRDHSCFSSAPEHSSVLDAVDAVSTL